MKAFVFDWIAKQESPPTIAQAHAVTGVSNGTLWKYFTMYERAHGIGSVVMFRRNNEITAGPTRLCITCGKVFWPRHPASLFCGEACKQTHQKARARERYIKNKADKVRA